VRRLALVPIVTATFLFPHAVQAMGLGKIETQSALNQRLDAEIPLRGVQADQSDAIEVSLASEEAFADVGLERPYSLTQLAFEVSEGDDGYYVHVTSDEPISEPFLSFLIAVEWPGGNLLREYTVLLDPPVLTSNEGQDSGDGGAAETTASAQDGGDASTTVRSESTTSGTTATETASGGTDTASGNEEPRFLETGDDGQQRSDGATRAADATSAGASDGRASDSGQTASGASTAGAGEYGPVAEGETLWNIAARLKRGDMTVQQMMIALLRSNPDAFEGGNINRLNEGYVLRVPTAQKVRSVSAQQAIARVREQNGVWREWQDDSQGRAVAASDQGTGERSDGGASAGADDDAELAIVGSDEGDASSDESASATGNGTESTSEELQLAREKLESARMEKKELASRVEDLEETVSKMKKLLTVRSDKLSKLEKQLEQARGETSGDGSVEQAEADAGSSEDDNAMAELATGDGSDGATGTDGSGDDATGESAASADSEQAEQDMAAAGEGGSEAAASEAASGDAGSDGAAAGDSVAATTDGASTDSGDGVSAESDGTAASAASTDSQAAATDVADGEAYVPAGKQATAEDRGVQTIRTQQGQSGWLETAGGALGAAAAATSGFLMSPIGLGVLAVVLVLVAGAVLVQRRRGGGEAEQAGAAAAEPVLDSANDASNALGEPGAAASEPTGETALLSESFDMDALDAEADGASVPLDETASEADADKDDTIAEADIYLAYQLHQQAKDLLQLGLKEQPQNPAYHAKLLETMYAAGDKDEFVDQASTFRGLVDGASDARWQRVVQMGSEIAPENALFTDDENSQADAAGPAAATAGASAAAGDLDFDLDDFGPGDETETASGAPTGATTPEAGDGEAFDATMMLDGTDGDAVAGDGGLVGPDEPAGEASRSDGGGELDFDLDDMEATGPQPASTGSGSDSPGAADDGLAFDLSDLESADAASEPPAGGDDASASLDFDLDAGESETPAAGSPAEASGGQSSEIDLDFDLGDSEGPTPPIEQGAGDSADDNALDLGFDLERTSEAAAEAAPRPATGNAGEADDALELSDIQLDDEPERPEPATSGNGDAAAGEAVAGGATGAGTEAPRGGAELDAGDLDLSDLEAESGPDEAEAPAEFDLGELDTGADAAGEVEAAPVSEAPAPESEIGAGEEGEADDFDTMIDLARAYIDMGDSESAATTLDEVANGGTEKQQSEARELLASVR